LARESFDPFKDSGGMFWGGDEVLRWLKKYVQVERAGADPNIYLVDRKSGVVCAKARI
jgi:hypothetical protein